MEYAKAKNIFNSIIFFFAGIVSIFRHESLEAVIAFAFCGIFFTILLIIKKKNDELLPEEYNIKLK